MLKTWASALRLKTLVVSVASITVGTSVLLGRLEEFPVLLYLGCLSFALLVQIGTNFTNDYFDYLYGADQNRKLSPDRVIASGQLTSQSIQNAYRISFLLALLVGTSVVLYAGASLWFFPFGVICILAGYFYTGGPYPLAYNALGDVFVILFLALLPLRVQVYSSLKM